MARFDKRPYADTWVKYLKSKGYHVYILSNYSKLYAGSHQKGTDIPQRNGWRSIFLLC